MSNIVVLKDGVIVKIVDVLKDKAKSAGLAVPDDDYKAADRGEVIAVGPDVESIKVGDTVLFNRYMPSDVDMNGERMLYLLESDILAILPQ